MINNKINNGITLIEILIAMSLLSILAVFTTNIMVNMNSNNSLMEASNLMKNRDQTALNKIGREINSSKMFIGRVPTVAGSTAPYQYGTEYYLPKLDIPTNFKVGNEVCNPLMLINRVLPMIKSNMSFSPLDNNVLLPRVFDISAVGNSLLIATVADSINAQYTSTTGELRTRTIDLIQFSYYYLARTATTRDKRGNPYLYLMKWKSNYYLDYRQVSNTLIDTLPLKQKDFFDSIKVAKPINNPYIPLADVWNYENKLICGSTANYFYTLGSSALTATNCTSYKISMFSNERATLVDGYSNSITYSIERNNNFTGNAKVPLYGQVVTSNDGYPHGFEVMIGGPSGSRKVFTRILRRANRASGQSVYSETSSLFQGSDL